MGRNIPREVWFVCVCPFEHKKPSEGLNVQRVSWYRRAEDRVCPRDKFQLKFSALSGAVSGGDTRRFTILSLLDVCSFPLVITAVCFFWEGFGRALRSSYHRGNRRRCRECHGNVNIDQTVDYSWGKKLQALGCFPQRSWWAVPTTQTLLTLHGNYLLGL